jgi:hypothetical protein
LKPKPQQKRKGQNLKNQSNSLRQSRSELQPLNATPSTPKAKQKKGTAIIFCQQQRNDLPTKYL